MVKSALFIDYGHLLASMSTLRNKNYRIDLGRFADWCFYISGSSNHDRAEAHLFDAEPNIDSNLNPLNPRHIDELNRQVEGFTGWTRFKHAVEKKLKINFHQGVQTPDITRSTLTVDNIILARQRKFYKEELERLERMVIKNEQHNYQRNLTKFPQDPDPCLSRVLQQKRVDTLLTLEVARYVYTRDDIDQYILVAGDSDFIPLIKLIYDAGKQVHYIYGANRAKALLDEVEFYYTDSTYPITKPLLRCLERNTQPQPFIEIYEVWKQSISVETWR